MQLLGIIMEILTFQRHSWTKPPRPTQLSYQQILSQYYFMSDYYFTSDFIPKKPSTHQGDFRILCNLPRGVTSSQEASLPEPYTKWFCRLIKVNLINGYLALVHQKSTHATVIYLLKGSVGFWPKSFRSLSWLVLGFTFPVWSRSVLLNPLIWGKQNPYKVLDLACTVFSEEHIAF